MKILHQQTLFFLLIVFILSGCAQQIQLVVLHTNDTHSRIEPLPETDRTAPGMGGVVRRATYIDGVRKENKNVLLFDAGDFLQGTPYFNLFKGEVEVEAMNMMGYDAATLGNHEFDYGLDVLEKFSYRVEQLRFFGHAARGIDPSLPYPKKERCTYRCNGNQYPTSGVDSCRAL